LDRTRRPALWSPLPSSLSPRGATSSTGRSQWPCAFSPACAVSAPAFSGWGALADFLSKPILTGFLNGIALSIALGQLGKLFEFPIVAGGIIPRLLEFIGKLGLTHGPTLAVGLASFAVLLVAPRVVPRVPAVVTMIDVSGLYMARDFIDTLSARGVTFGMAGRQTEWSQWNERHKLETCDPSPR
jgi:MFS superfamily sulfate permease-like transporter